MPKRKNKAIHRPDTKGKPFIGIPHVVLKSEAYRQLSYPARAVLIEIVLRFYGFNNGKIVVSQRQLMQGLDTKAAGTVIRAIAELMEHGLIVVEAEGDHYARRAREFRLTFVNTTNGNGDRVPATNDYLGYKGKETTKENGSRNELDHHKTDTSSVSETTFSDTGKRPAEITKISKNKDLRKNDSRQSGAPSAPHITKPYPRPIGWSNSRNEIVGQIVTYIDPKSLHPANDHSIKMD